MGVLKYTDIDVRGRIFPNVRAVCDHFGLTKQTVIMAVRSGRTDGIGLGKVGRVPGPVEIRGILYLSAKIAAKAIGVAESTINLAIDEGRTDTVGLRLPRGASAISKPFDIAHLSWPSMSAASRDLGFSPGYIGQAFRLNRRPAKERILAAAMALDAQRMAA